MGQVWTRARQCAGLPVALAHPLHGLSDLRLDLTGGLTCDPVLDWLSEFDCVGVFDLDNDRVWLREASCGGREGVEGWGGVRKWWGHR
jgi:hypothetical protein